MPRCGRPSRRAVSRPVCADQKNLALSVDTKHRGASTVGPHPARPAPAAAPHDPPHSANVCRSAIGRPIPGHRLRRGPTKRGVPGDEKDDDHQPSNETFGDHVDTSRPYPPHLSRGDCGPTSQIHQLGGDRTWYGESWQARPSPLPKRWFLGANRPDHSRIRTLESASSRRPTTRRSRPWPGRPSRSSG